MNKLSLSIILSALCFGQIFAQKSTKEIKGDKYYSFYSFDKAIEKYSQADILTVDGNRKLAESYRNINNTAKAEEVYAKYINDKDAIADDYYNYAAVLKTNGKYAEANKWMDKFKQASPNDLRAKNYAANNAQLTNLLKDEGRYKIEHLNINTDQQDFGTAYYNNKIVFASSRGGNKSVKRSYNWNQKPFLDLYVADKSDEQLKDPKNLNKHLNKKMHEGPASFANEGKMMAFTRNDYSGKSKDGVVKLQIFFAELKDDKWTNETAYKLNSSEYSVGHPCLTSDGNTMYFASDMPGGFGGADLYVVKKDANGVWGEAKNLGDKINTEGNEMFPYFEESNEFLFFASNGHLGLGGLDVFITPVKGDGFGKILNMGAPLNTQYDDFSLIIDDKMRKGYFSSNRVGGSGDDDIYAFELMSPFSFGKTIKGLAKEKDGNILSGALVKLYDDAGKEVGSVTTASDGAYSFTVDADKSFKLNGAKEKYFDGKNTASTAVPEDVIVADVVLEKDPGLSLLAIVTDAGTKQPLDGVNVTITETPAAKPFDSYTTTATGDYHKPLSNNKIGDKLYYTIKLEKAGYLTKTVVFEKIIDKAGEIKIHEALDLSLGKLEVGGDLAKMIDIKPIYFDLGKYNIRKDAAVELEKIVKIMNEYPSMVVELGSHTDCRATAAFNMKLSDNRAKASAEYIKKKISNPERIYGKGYGESKLKNGCACEGAVKSTCTEAEHQENRRTEFIIIKM